MKIHTDKLTRADLFAHVPSGCYLDASQRGSRKRARAFDVHMYAKPGTDTHGIKRCYATNSGGYGAGEYKAATYIEWGDWMVELFKIDPNAIIGTYDETGGFIGQTQHWAPTRPARENAQYHADRWAKTLSALHEERLTASDA